MKIKKWTIADTPGTEPGRKFDPDDDDAPPRHFGTKGTEIDPELEQTHIRVIVDEYAAYVSNATDCYAWIMAHGHEPLTDIAIFHDGEALVDDWTGMPGHVFEALAENAYALDLYIGMSSGKSISARTMFPDP